MAANQEPNNQPALPVEVEVEVEEERRPYKCNYCDRVFSSSQALGGHQNGHREERGATKRARQEAELYGLHGPPPQLPLHMLAPQHLYPYVRESQSWPPPRRPLQQYHYQYPYQIPPSRDFVRVNWEQPQLRAADPGYGVRMAHLLASSSSSGGAALAAATVEEEQRRAAVHFQIRNSDPSTEVAAQPIVHGASTSSSVSLDRKKETEETTEGGGICVNEEIDLTLRL